MGMEYLFGLKNPAIAAIAAAFYLAAAGQLLHVLILLTRRDVRPFAPTVLFETLLFAHLLLAAGAANSIHSGYGEAIFRLKALSIPIEQLLWVDGAAALLGAGVVFLARRPAMVVEVVLLALITPPAIDALGNLTPFLFIVDAAFFASRVGALLTLDVRVGRHSTSRLSVIDSIRVLPEGVICADDEGRLLFMNDSMRSCLTALGFAPDLSETHDIWGRLLNMARRTDGAEIFPEGVRIEIFPGQVRLFVRDRVRLGHKECRRMVAFDVTEEESINSDIERTNRLLDRANAELAVAIENAREASRNEAVLRMRSRVHDTVGQRLSILHRYLEDDDPDPEKLAQVTELARTAVKDLAEQEDIDAPAALRAIENAFSLVGIAIVVEGPLPGNPEVASAFVDVVREAATNAAKHGRARRVDIRLHESADSYLLIVRNDGDAAPAAVREGTGFPSMRRTLARVGGSLEVSSTFPFAIEARIPRVSDSKGTSK